MEAEGFYGDGVGGGGVVLLGDDAEVAAVVPHGPADVELLEGGADVVEVAGTGVGWGFVAVGAELVADDGDVVLVGPGAGELETAEDGLLVPSGGGVEVEGVASAGVRDVG